MRKDIMNKKFTSFTYFLLIYTILSFPMNNQKKWCRHRWYEEEKKTFMKLRKNTKKLGQFNPYDGVKTQNLFPELECEKLNPKIYSHYREIENQKAFHEYTKSFGNILQQEAEERESKQKTLRKIQKNTNELGLFKPYNNTETQDIFPEFYFQNKEIKEKKHESE